MCATCLEGCPGYCEVGKSAFRGSEVIYPQPFGTTTSAAEKEYPLGWAHFNIMGSVVGAHGIEPDPDKAVFPNVRLEREVGAENKMRVGLPFIIPGLGSTDVARNNWEGLAAGAALAGVPLTVGENVCGMDEQAVIQDGRVVESPDLRFRVESYRRWQRDGLGGIIVQENVEDSRLGVLFYALEKLHVDAVELKWGQGAKDIGGEVKIASLDKARMLRDRGYVVLPDPYDQAVAEAFERGAFREFERHSRIGMVSEEAFFERVEQLRAAGAPRVFLKTGAYRPADLARAVKWSSEARIDLLTVDCAGGGTGMSPWRMMNEWGVPAIELFALLYSYAHRLAQRGEYVPDIAIAGGFCLEDQVFKGLAFGAPYFKLVAMARAPITAAMVGKTIGNALQSGNLPAPIKEYGRTIEDIFITAPELRRMLGDKFDNLPPAAIGVYTYFTRLRQGLQQLMCGARKFALEYLERTDIAALTPEAARVSGIPYVLDLDAEEVEEILG